MFVKVSHKSNYRVCGLRGLAFSLEASADYPGVWFPFAHKNADSPCLNFWWKKKKISGRNSHAFHYVHFAPSYEISQCHSFSLALTEELVYRGQCVKTVHCVSEPAELCRWCKNGFCWRKRNVFRRISCPL